LAPVHSPLVAFFFFDPSLYKTKSNIQINCQKSNIQITTYGDVIHSLYTSHYCTLHISYQSRKTSFETYSLRPSLSVVGETSQLPMTMANDAGTPTLIISQMCIWMDMQLMLSPHHSSCTINKSEFTPTVSPFYMQYSISS
jgi:hypothetical protein